MNRGDIKLAYDRATAHDVPDVADRLYEMAERIRALEAHNAVLCDGIDTLLYCVACGFTLTADKKAAIETALASTPESSLAEIRRAERERCAKVCDHLDRKEKSHAAGYGFGYLNYTAQDCAEAIRQMED